MERSQIIIDTDVVPTYLSAKYEIRNGSDQYIKNDDNPFLEKLKTETYSSSKNGFTLDNSCRLYEILSNNPTPRTRNKLRYPEYPSIGINFFKRSSSVSRVDTRTVRDINTSYSLRNCINSVSMERRSSSLFSARKISTTIDRLGKGIMRATLNQNDFGFESRNPINQSYLTLDLFQSDPLGCVHENSLNSFKSRSVSRSPKKISEELSRMFVSSDVAQLLTPRVISCDSNCSSDSENSRYFPPDAMESVMDISNLSTLADIRETCFESIASVKNSESITNNSLVADDIEYTIIIQNYNKMSKLINLMLSANSEEDLCSSRIDYSFLQDNFIYLGDHIERQRVPLHLLRRTVSKSYIPNISKSSSKSVSPIKNLDFQISQKNMNENNLNNIVTINKKNPELNKLHIEKSRSSGNQIDSQVKTVATNNIEKVDNNIIYNKLENFEHTIDSLDNMKHLSTLATNDLKNNLTVSDTIDHNSILKQKDIEINSSFKKVNCMAQEPDDILTYNINKNEFNDSRIVTDFKKNKYKSNSEDDYNLIHRDNISYYKDLNNISLNETPKNSPLLSSSKNSSNFVFGDRQLIISPIAETINKYTTSRQNDNIIQSQESNELPSIYTSDSKDLNSMILIGKKENSAESSNERLWYNESPELTPPPPISRYFLDQSVVIQLELTNNMIEDNLRRLKSIRSTRLCDIMKQQLLIQRNINAVVNEVTTCTVMGTTTRMVFVALVDYSRINDEKFLTLVNNQITTLQNMLDKEHSENKFSDFAY